MAPEKPTALENAHARFREGLARRGEELLALAERAASAGVEGPVLEELGRRVHALYASAEVFHEEELTRKAREVARVLDLAREHKKPLGEIELHAVSTLAAELGAATKPIAIGPAQPVALTRTLSGTLPAPDLVAVLLVAGNTIETAVRKALPMERCELTTSRDLGIALDVVDQVAPDVVVIEASLLGTAPADAVSYLRGERTASPRAIAIVLPEDAPEDSALVTIAGADAVLQMPLPEAGLLERLHRVARPERPAPRPSIESPVAGTVEQIAAEVAEQVRRGLVDAVRAGRDERIELGDRAELLAATWSAVSRIRAHLTDAAGGRVRFDTRPTGTPVGLALTDQQAAEPYVELTEVLQGKRIVVADDDPAVLWFFGGLLREAGALVVEAADGRSALEAARRRPPDVLISDILMPGVDGFALCRELKRDLALRHLPVILLSWKEDFLQRMRELDAGAAGYLRKEAGSHQILHTVAHVLAARTELERVLDAGEEVRGRLDQLGADRLLRTVAVRKPDARITVRDAHNLFEIEIRGGSALAITRTAADGTFGRGMAALKQLLGVSSGRFTVSPPEGAARGLLAEPLDIALVEATRGLGSLLDAVSDAYLLRVERVTLDDEVLGSLLSATPTELAEVATFLRSAEPVSRLVLSGRWSARELEEHLRELVRHGAITGVYGALGEDLAGEARATREHDPGALLHASRAVRRASERPMEVDDDEVDLIESVLEETDSSEPLFEPLREEDIKQIGDAAGDAGSELDASEVVAEPDGGNPFSRTGRWQRERWQTLEGIGTLPAGVLRAESAPEPMRAEVAASDTLITPLPHGTAQPVAPADSQPHADSEPATPELAAPERAAPEPSHAATAARSTLEPLSKSEPVAETRIESRAEPSSPAASGVAHSDRPSPAPAAAGSGAGFTVRSRLLDAPVHTIRPPRAPVVPEPVKLGWGTFVGTFLLMASLGYVGWSHLRPVLRKNTPQPASINATTQLAAKSSSEPREVEPAPKPEPSVIAGRTLPFVDRSRGIEVTEQQGLLVLEHESSAPPPQLSLSGRELPPPPTALAVDAGRHELVLSTGDMTRFRYLLIRAGETRIVQVDALYTPEPIEPHPPLEQPAQP